MKNADIMLTAAEVIHHKDRHGGDVTKYGNLTVTDRFTFKIEHPNMDTDIEGSDDILEWGTSVSEEEKKLISRWKRKKVTGDIFDRNLLENLTLDFIVALGDNHKPTAAHSHAFMFKIDLSRGVVVHFPNPYLNAHASLMFVGFVKIFIFFIFCFIFIFLFFFYFLFFQYLKREFCWFLLLLLQDISRKVMKSGL